ncbi:MAG: hypothetical protein WA093_03970 [Minisyncoccales bacterium]|jgi:hypothetical protein|nr:hypothetical protein [Candidatus Pacearchaeota archaeon]
MAVYLLAGLGLCEHCGNLITLEGFPIEAIDAEWRCPKCQGILGGKSFGYEGDGKKAQKVWWVGPDGKWVKIKPTEEFDLDSWHIIIQPRIL